MSIADGIILGIIALSAVVSLWRGFVREALSLLTWAAAFIVARLFSPQLDSYLVDTIEMPSLRMAVAFGLLFVVVLILGAIIGKLTHLLVKATGLSGTDRVLGMVFGALRGVLIVTVLVALFRPMIEEDPWWESSHLAPYFVGLEGWTKEMGKQTFQFFWQLEPTKAQASMQPRGEEAKASPPEEEIVEKQPLNQ